MNPRGDSKSKDNSHWVFPTEMKMYAMKSLFVLTFWRRAEARKVSFEIFLLCKFDLYLLDTKFSCFLCELRAKYQWILRWTHVLGIQANLFTFYNSYVAASDRTKTKRVKPRCCEEVSLWTFHCEVKNTVIMLWYNKETVKKVQILHQKWLIGKKPKSDENSI